MRVSATPIPLRGTRFRRTATAGTAGRPSAAARPRAPAACGLCRAGRGWADSVSSCLQARDAPLQRLLQRVERGDAGVLRGSTGLGRGWRTESPGRDCGVDRSRGIKKGTVERPVAAVHAEATGILPVRQSGHSQELSGMGAYCGRRLAAHLLEKRVARRRRATSTAVSAVRRPVTHSSARSSAHTRASSGCGVQARRAKVAACCRRFPLAFGAQRERAGRFASEVCEQAPGVAFHLSRERHAPPFLGQQMVEEPLDRAIGRCIDARFHAQPERRRHPVPDTRSRREPATDFTDPSHGSSLQQSCRNFRQGRRASISRRTPCDIHCSTPTNARRRRVHPNPNRTHRRRGRTSRRCEP